MKIKNVTLAGFSDLLYHATKVNQLLDILKENKIRMSVDMGTESLLNSKMKKSKKFRPYFLSLSRVKFGGYCHTIKPEQLTIIELDGTKLRTKYAGEPVDYWGENYRNPDFYTQDERMKKAETEDRIYAVEPNLEPLNKYVRSIHVMMPPEFAQLKTNRSGMSPEDIDIAQKQSKTYEELQRAAKTQNIRIFFYAKFSDMKMLNVRKALTENLAWIDYERDIRNVNEVFEAIIKKDYSHLSKEANQLLLYADYPHNLQGIKSSISNSKKDALGREAIDKLIMYMRRFKLRSMDEVEDLFKLKKKEMYA